MSQVNVDTIRKSDGSLGTDIRVKNTSVYESDGGTSVTQNMVEGLAKVWCNIDASSAVQDSLNIASITDHTNGQNTFNYTNAYSALTYVALGHNSDDATANRGTNVQGTWTGGNQSTSKVRMNTFSSADCSYYGLASHGALA